MHCTVIPQILILVLLIADNSSTFRHLANGGTIIDIDHIGAHFVQLG